MDSTIIYCATCGAANPPDAERCFACGNPPKVNTLAEFIPAAIAPNGAFSSALPASQLLKGRYRLLRQVGAGGFGAVYQAQDTQLGNRLVAVKEMSQRGLTPEELREATVNFQREALLLASLHHPNLPHIYEQFEEGGRWYLVMEFIEGETLEARLSRAPAGLSIEEALQIGLQLSKALGYLHSRQPPIIFRDLKPANIMLTPEGQVYLIDFGIARLFKPGQTRDTESFGSAGYAAPEQYGKAQTTAQSDIYGLGATLYHLLSGDDPSDHPFLFKPLSLPAAPALAKLVTWMLEQDHTQRPANMLAIEQTLQRIADAYADGKTLASPATPVSSSEKMQLTSTAPTKWAVAQPASAKRHFSPRDQLMGCGILVGAILLGLIISWGVSLSSFQQDIQTSQTVPYIQVGNSYIYASNTLQGESATFHAGDIVYVAFTLADTSQLSFTAKLFLGSTLEYSDTKLTFETPSASPNEVLYVLDEPSFTGIPLVDHTVVAQPGIYKWEIDDTFGNFWASITFKVT